MAHQAGAAAYISVKQTARDAARDPQGRAGCYLQAAVSGPLYRYWHHWSSRHPESGWEICKSRKNKSTPAGIVIATRRGNPINSLDNLVRGPPCAVLFVWRCIVCTSACRRLCTRRGGLHKTNRSLFHFTKQAKKRIKYGLCQFFVRKRLESGKNNKKFSLFSPFFL